MNGSMGPLSLLSLKSLPSSLIQGQPRHNKMLAHIYFYFPANNCRTGGKALLVISHISAHGPPVPTSWCWEWGYYHTLCPGLLWRHVHLFHSAWCHVSELRSRVCAHSTGAELFYLDVSDGEWQSWTDPCHQCKRIDICHFDVPFLYAFHKHLSLSCKSKLPIIFLYFSLFMYFYGFLKPVFALLF